MPPDYDADAWIRLGRAVKRARLRAGMDTTRWAVAVGRSSRVLLGLERGEPVGDDTLRRVEEALGWQDGRVYELLDGKSTEVVGPPAEDDVYVARTEDHGPPLRDATKDELLAEIARRIAEEP